MFNINFHVFFQGALKRHFQRCHPDVALTEDLCWKCDSCPESFPVKYQLMRHVKEMHPPEKVKESGVQCTQCPKQFKSRSALDKHVESSHKSSTCNECGKVMEV